MPPWRGFGSEMGNFTDAITIRYTLAEADPGHLLTKRFGPGSTASLVKQAAANPVRGVFTDIEHAAPPTRFWTPIRTSCARCHRIRRSSLPSCRAVSATMAASGG